jgi:hypothetical protein
MWEKINKFCSHPSSPLNAGHCFACKCLCSDCFYYFILNNFLLQNRTFCQQPNMLEYKWWNNDVIFLGWDTLWCQEDGDSMFLQVHTVSQPRKITVSSSPLWAMKYYVSAGRVKLIFNSFYWRPYALKCELSWTVLFSLCWKVFLFIIMISCQVFPF